MQLWLGKKQPREFKRENRPKMRRNRKQDGICKDVKKI
jgi:hypothetical protein